MAVLKTICWKVRMGILFKTKQQYRENPNYQISVEQHFCSIGQDFNSDEKFTIRKRINKNINKSSIIGKKGEKRKKETKWIKSRQTFVPSGFNIKLNHLPSNQIRQSKTSV